MDGWLGEWRSWPGIPWTVARPGANYTWYCLTLLLYQCCCILNGVHQQHRAIIQVLS